MKSVNLLYRTIAAMCADGQDVEKTDNGVRITVRNQENEEGEK